MKLFILKNLDHNCGLVVRAKDAEQARYLASQVAADEGRDLWLDSERSNCEPLGVCLQAGEPGVVLVDCLNG